MRSYNYQVVEVTATTTPAQALAEDGYRRGLIIQNDGSVGVWVGFSADTSQLILLAAGTQWQPEVTPTNPIFVRSVSSTSAVSIMHATDGASVAVASDAALPVMDLEFTEENELQASDITNQISWFWDLADFTITLENTDVLEFTYADGMWTLTDGEFDETSGDATLTQGSNSTPISFTGATVPE